MSRALAQGIESNRSTHGMAGSSATDLEAHIFKVALRFSKGHDQDGNAKPLAARL